MEFRLVPNKSEKNVIIIQIKEDSEFISLVWGCGGDSEEGTQGKGIREGVRMRGIPTAG